MTDGNMRSYMLDELGDPDAPKGSRLWLLYVANEIRKTYYDAQQSGHRLDNYVKAFKEFNGWQEYGYLTWEQYRLDRLQAKADDVDREATRRTIEAATNAVPLNANGGNRKTEQ